MNNKTIITVLVTVLLTAAITAAFSVLVLFPMLEPAPVITEPDTSVSDLFEASDEIDATEDGDYVKVDKSEYLRLKEVYDKYNKADLLEAFIRQNFYQDVSDVDFVSGVYKGIFEALEDPYSVYFTPEEFKAYMESAQGEYEGIGVVVEPGDDGFINVVTPFPDSPGFKAGLKPNDKILKVDGVEFTAAQLDEAVRNIRGEKNTIVVLTIKRGDEIFDVDVTREKITLETVESEVLEDNVGYVKMKQFDKDVAAELKEHVKALEKEDIEGLIIDLRYNGGGYLDQCLEVTDFLIGEGIIVKTRDNQGNVDIERSDASRVDYPIVLIVNEGSASASEILTGAVKDNEEGTIVGTTTFGKGLVQTVIPLESFDNAGLKITVEQYFTPDDHYINKIGIEPDVVIEDDPETEADEQLDKAIEVLIEKINE